ncbi:unnamed protein product [Linum trigynum]|uniref:Uncharacterized protein n=1 Tax=Linum trigynum TaxID=586398 RepID=A0AAV2E741_9ROSI
MFQNSRQKKLSLSDGSPFTFLGRQVDEKAIILIKNAEDKLKKRCSCHYPVPHGLKCGCQVKVARASDIEIYPDKLHVFWQSLEYENPPNAEDYGPVEKAVKQHLYALAKEVVRIGPGATSKEATSLFRGLHLPQDTIHAVDYGPVEKAVQQHLFALAKEVVRIGPEATSKEATRLFCGLHLPQDTIHESTVNERRKGKIEEKFNCERNLSGRRKHCAC